MIDKCFDALDNATNPSEYISVYNFIFEMFVTKYRQDNSIPPQENISVYKAFRELGAINIDNNYNIALSMFKEIRNDFTHDITDMDIKLHNALKMQEEFHVFMKQYGTLLGSKDYTHELKNLTEPIKKELI